MFPVRKPLILTIVQVKSVHDKDLLIIDFNLIDIKDVYNMILELLTITVQEVIVRFVDTGGIADHHC
jgi:hypothetical protein